MGGTDKGLQNFHGTPMALHTLLRLQNAARRLVGQTLVNANRHLAAYEGIPGAPCGPDTMNDYAGPLAGFRPGWNTAKLPGC